MKFISTEQFLKLDKEVQKVFIDWWKVEIGDLFKYNYGYSNIEIINLRPCNLKDSYRDEGFCFNFFRP